MNSQDNPNQATSTFANQTHPKNYSSLLVTLILISLLAVFNSYQVDPIQPLPADADTQVFSAGRAFNYLETLTKEQVPHAVDTPANRVVESRIVDTLRNLGFQAEIQDTQFCRDSKWGSMRCMRVRNIIVEIAGTEPGNGVLLSAHYDSVPASPGGSDAGAAVGALLEIARLIATQPRPRNSIVLLFNEGEEFGLFGAHAFMQQHPLAKQLKVALNIEARGTSGKSVMFETGEDSGWLVKQYQDSTPSPLSSSLFYEVYKFMPNDTDMTVYKEHGLQGLNFAHGDMVQHYHTEFDNLATLNKGSLQHHGDNVWGVLQRIKDRDFSQVEKGNLVYTDLSGITMIGWPESWTLTISLMLLLILISMLVVFRDKLKLTMWGTLAGLIYSLIAVVLAGAAALVAQTLAQQLAVYSAPWFANPLPMRYLVYSGSALAVLGVIKLLMFRLNWQSIFAGVVLFWSLLGLATAVYLPGVSFLFILPLIAATVLIVVMVILRIDVETNLDKGLNKGAAVCILLAISSAFVFVPVAIVLELLLSFWMSLAVGVMLGFGLTGALPLLAQTSPMINSSEQTKWNSLGFKWPMLALSAVFLVAMGWTVLQAPFSKQVPQGQNLWYLQLPEDEAFVVIGEAHHLIPETMTETAGEFKLEALLPWRKRTYYHQGLESEKMAPAKLKVLSDTIEADKRVLEVQVEGPLKDLIYLQLFIPVSSGLQKVWGEGGEASFTEEEGRYSAYHLYECIGQSCSNIKLKLELASIEKRSAYLVTRQAGLPERLSVIANSRGDESVKIQNGDMSIVVDKIDL